MPNAEQDNVHDVTHLCIMHRIPQLIKNDHSAGSRQIDADRTSFCADHVHLQRITPSLGGACMLARSTCGL